MVWRAGARLGIRAPDAVPAEAAGLIRFDATVTFARPFDRAEIYHAASARDRRLVHRALARATRARTDPDRHAWHRAHSKAAPDERSARQLERQAERARRREVGSRPRRHFWPRPPR